MKRAIATRVWDRYFKIVGPLVRRFSLIGSGPIWRRDELPWIAHLEQSHALIMDEFHRYRSSGLIVPDKEDIAPGSASRYGVERWEMLHLLVYDQPTPDLARHFPETLRLAEAHVPSLCSIVFSRLPPERRHIPRHRDSDNGTLRMHLGLAVPSEGACFITVGEDSVQWHVGEGFVMDATCEHEVTKDADAERIILIIDFYRPVPGWVDWLTHRVYRRYGGILAKRRLRASYSRILQRGRGS